MSQELLDQLNSAQDVRTINYLNVAKQLQFGGGVFPNFSGGNLFYVSSVTGNDTTGNGTIATPYATVNKAVSVCTANHGDWVVALPGHVETVSGAAGLTVGVAGVTIYWLGNDADRAQVNFTTSTAATATITAASCTIVGMRVVNAIDARVDGFIVSGAGCKMIDTEWVDGTGTSSLISIRTTSAANRFTLNKCRVNFAENTGTARTEFLRVVGGAMVLVNDFYNHPAATYSTATINNVTTATSPLVVRNAQVSNGTTAPALVTVSTSVLEVYDSTFLSAAGTSAITVPTTSGDYIVDNASSISNGTYSSALQQGQPILFQKNFTSSAITTGGITAFTCTGGSISIEAITFETDSTGLAGMTNLVLSTNNANGLATIFSQAITALGANKIVAGSAGATTAFTADLVFESTKTISIAGTSSNGTGGGKVFVLLRGKVLSGAPTIS